MSTHTHTHTHTMASPLVLTVTHGKNGPDPVDVMLLETGGLIMDMAITRKEDGNINIWLEHDPKMHEWDGCSEMFEYHLEIQLERVAKAESFTLEEKKAVIDTLRTQLKNVKCHACDHHCQ